MIFEGGQFFGGGELAEACPLVFPAAVFPPFVDTLAAAFEPEGAADWQSAEVDFFLPTGFFAGCGCAAGGLEGVVAAGGCFASAAGACCCAVS